MYLNTLRNRLRSLGLIAASFLTTAVALDAQIVWNFTDGTFNASSIPVNMSVTALVAHNVGNGAANINAVSANGSSGNNLAMSAKTGALDLATSSYYEFTVTAAEGFAVQLGQMSINTRSSSTGPNLVSFYYVIPGFEAKDGNPSSVSTGVSGNWQNRASEGSIGVVSAFGGPITFRIYGSGGSSSPSSENWRLDNISFAAVAMTPAEVEAAYPKPVPEPAEYAAGFGAAGLIFAIFARSRRRRSVA